MITDIKLFQTDPVNDLWACIYVENGKIFWMEYRVSKSQAEASAESIRFVQKYEYEFKDELNNIYLAQIDVVSAVNECLRNNPILITEIHKDWEKILKEIKSQTIEDLKKLKTIQEEVHYL